MKLNLSVAEAILIFIIAFTLGVSACSKYAEFQEYQKKNQIESQGEENET